MGVTVLAEWRREEGDRVDKGSEVKPSQHSLGCWLRIRKEVLESC